MTEFLAGVTICSFSRSLENALPDGGQSPEEIAQEAQRRQLVAAALDSLTAKQRTIVLLRHRDGQTWAAIAAELHVSPAAACQTSTRAIAALRRWFAAHDIHSLTSL